MSSRRRVALVVPGLEEGGGVPVVALFLHDVLDRTNRYEPRLISIPMSSADACSVRLASPASWAGGVRRREGTYKGLPFEHVGAFLTEFEFQRYRARRVLTRILDEHEIVQVVAGAPSWALAAADCRRPLGLQVATTVAAERVSAQRGASGARGLVRRAMTALATRMEATALCRADRTFVENRWMLEHVERIAGAGRAVFAPPGIDTDRFTPREPRDGDGYILSVGRLADPRKNVAMLFRAYAVLVEALPSAPRLVLAGLQGPLDDDWKVASALGIRDRIEFRANVPADELVELYRGAGLYALSSNEEGLGLVILEAMACGCPVISTDCGGPTTSIVEGETGYLVPVGDHLAFAERMRIALADGERLLRMRGAARRRASESFSIEAAGRPFVSWYDELTASRV